MRSKYKPRRLAAALACAAGVGGAAAAPVSYSEAVGGDLAGSGALTVFALDVGVNSVSGTTGFTLDGPTDFDSFAFTVPAGTQLVSLVLTLVDDAGNAGDFIRASWQLYAGSTTAYAGTSVQALTPLSPGTASVSAVPLEPGSYNIVALGAAGSISRPSLGDYRFELTVAADPADVPEPGSLALAAFALAGAGAAVNKRRRRR